MTERELLVDCLRRLNGVAITYYLTGSMASNYWGIPRTTDRQLGDAAGVVAVQQEKLDNAYLRKWAEQLGVRVELDALLKAQIKPKQT
jgi:hypothetical protein